MSCDPFRSPSSFSDVRRTDRTLLMSSFGLNSKSLPPPTGGRGWSGAKTPATLPVRPSRAPKTGLAELLLAQVDDPRRHGHARRRKVAAVTDPRGFDNRRVRLLVAIERASGPVAGLLCGLPVGKHIRMGNGRQRKGRYDTHSMSASLGKHTRTWRTILRTRRQRDGLASPAFSAESATPQAAQCRRQSGKAMQLPDALAILNQ
jgi:hypothetical protein